MAVDHLGEVSLDDLARMIREIATQTMQHVSIGRAGFRVHSGGFITVQNGGLDVTGTANVAGLLTGNGTFDWFGHWYLRGDGGISGDALIAGALSVTGGTTLAGNVTLNSDLNVGSGRILAGPVSIDRAGGYGGRVASSSILVLDAGSGILMDTNVDIRGILLTDGLDVDGPKNFRITHPTKPGYWLRHGSTESPVSGTQYHGRLTLDAAGEGVVDLPEYFEALNKPEGRTVQLTAIGRPFPVGADDVLDGRLKVYGDPGREIFWTVNAERKNADFPLEEEIPPEKRDDDEQAPDPVQ